MNLEEITKKSLVEGKISGLAFTARKKLELALRNLEFEKTEEAVEILHRKLGTKRLEEHKRSSKVRNQKAKDDYGRR
jgi:hypothetical protein